MTTPEGPGAPDGQEQPPAGPETEWKRVHPVSPLVRGWIALAAIAYFVGRDQVEGLFLREESSGPLPPGTPILPLYCAGASVPPSVTSTAPPVSAACWARQVMWQTWLSP